MNTEDDNSHWKWNTFYYNATDKRIFVPKKIPATGMTLNFAHPLSFFVVAIIIAMIIFFISKH